MQSGIGIDYMIYLGNIPAQVNDIDRIAAACGGWLGHQKTRCPCCGSKMSVTTGDKQPVVLWCWGSPPCAFRDIKNALARKGAWQGRRWSASPPSTTPKAAIAWHDIIAAAADRHPRLDRYLRSRAIEGDYSPYLQLLKIEDARRLGLASVPHMVAVVVDAAGQPRGCQVTELAVGSPGRRRHPTAAPCPSALAMQTLRRRRWSSVRVSKRSAPTLNSMTGCLGSRP
jgi:hypothetical protein